MSYKSIFNQLLIASAVIIETEAYWFGDAASHAFAGKTQRNASMFLNKGHWYVYKIYGIHHCLNLVANKSDVGEAVLIRAALPEYGIEFLRKNRGRESIKHNHELCSGPGKLCSAFTITRNWDGMPAVSQTMNQKSNLVLLENPQELQLRKNHAIVQSRRIGINKNAESLSRYYLDIPKFVSRR